MPLPAGITTATVTFGKVTGVLGTLALLDGSVSIDQPVYWAATGDAIFPFGEAVQVDDEGGGSFQFPHVDQPGFVDEHGAAITGFEGIFKGRVRTSPSDVRAIERRFQVLVGETSIELLLVPEGRRRPENAIAARTYAEQAKQYRDETAAQVVDLVAGATTQVGQLVADATTTLDTTLTEAEAGLQGIAGDAAASASAAASSAAAASGSAGDADMARLGALAAQAAAEAAQQAALEQVAAATEQATDATESAAAAAGSATAASDQRAAAETARTGAEAARNAIPALPVLATNRLKDPRAFEGPTTNQPSTTTVVTSGGPDTTPGGGSYTRKTFTAPSSLPAFTDIFYSRINAASLAAVVTGEYLHVGVWVRSSIAANVRVAYVALTSLTPVTGGGGSEAGSSVTLVPNTWTLLTYASSSPISAGGIYARVDVDSGSPAPQFVAGDTIDVAFGFLAASTNSFRYSAPALVPFSDLSAGARRGVASGLPELVTPRTDDIAVLARSANRYVDGIGSPEGVVFAPAGTQYVDLAETNGARVWRKRAGSSGNTGWTCVEGDTGWRDVSGLLVNGWVGATAGVAAVAICRTEAGVFWRIAALSPGSSTSAVALAPIPTGFRPDVLPGANPGRHTVHTVAAPPTAPTTRPTFFGTSGLNITRATTDNPYYGSLFYRTSDAWPTTLPGNPA